MLLRRDKRGKQAPNFEPLWNLLIELLKLHSTKFGHKNPDIIKV